MSTNQTQPAPRTWSDLDPYLKATHLQGKTHTVTIDRIEFTRLHPRPGAEEIKPVMYFTGKTKGLILTSTNQKFLRDQFGDEIHASTGSQVTLTPVQKLVAGRQVDTIILGIPADKKG